MRKNWMKRGIMALAAISVLSAGTAVHAAESYTVESGDYLKKIALKVYGDEAQWESIYEANREKIQNPNLIYAGQVLVLPDRVGESAVEQPGGAEQISENVQVPPEEEAAPEEKVYASLEEYLNDPEVKAELDDSIAAASLEGFGVSVTAKGNELTMEMKIPPEVMTKGMDAILKEMLEDFADDYRELAAALDEEVGQSGACTLVIRFLDPDDNVLAKKAYKAG